MTLVLVVDDSKFMRTVLRNTLHDYGYSVIEASDGEEAVNLAVERDPDVITMDVVMPEMNGLEATKKIMEKNPTPILMLSAHTSKGADITLDALKRGAVDFISKPGGKESPITAVEFGDSFVDKLEAVSNADVSKNNETFSGIGDGTVNVPKPEIPGQTKKKTDKEEGSDIDNIWEKEGKVHKPDHLPTIVIGASTGGPSLIEEILKKLPNGLQARIFVVQHMPAGFTKRYAERLNGKTTGFYVVEAKEGMSVKPGVVYIAPGDQNMMVTTDGSKIITEKIDEKQTTSISETLKSVSEAYEPPLVTALLTGMGADGSDVLDTVKDNGGYIIAQDSDTSPVFGIPRKAIQTGNVDEVLSDYKIAKGIIEGIETTSKQ